MNNNTECKKIDIKGEPNTDRVQSSSHLQFMYLEDVSDVFVQLIFGCQLHSYRYTGSFSGTW